MPNALRLGFIGLGLMGKPMAGHLLKAGFPLTVHNRSRGAVAELVAAGAQEAAQGRNAGQGPQGGAGCGQSRGQGEKAHHQER